MTKLAICDDDSKILSVLEAMIHDQYADQINVTTYQNPDEILDKYINAKTDLYDIIIFDIVLTQKNGIDYARKIQSLSNRTKIIFITAHLHYAPEIFKCEPIYLIHKPINKSKLVDAIERALAKLSMEQDEMITLACKKGIYRINKQYVSYIETYGRSLKIYHDGDDIIIRMRLDELMEKLGDGFVRCHQSYVVNMKFIKYIEAGNIVLFDETIIPISRNKLVETKQRLLDYIDENMKD